MGNDPLGPPLNEQVVLPCVPCTMYSSVGPPDIPNVNPAVAGDSLAKVANIRTSPSTVVVSCRLGAVNAGLNPLTAASRGLVVAAPANSQTPRVRKPLPEPLNEPLNVTSTQVMPAATLIA